MAQKIDFDKIEDILPLILKNPQNKYSFTLNFEDFISICINLNNQIVDFHVFVVLNGNWALAKFSKSGCVFRIFKKSKKGKIFRIAEDDFKVIKPFTEIHGLLSNFGYLDFLKEELSINGLQLIVFFIVCSLIFIILWLKIFFSISFLQTINQSLISIGAIFFSVYILFTFSQTIGNKFSNIYYKKGIPQRYQLIDKYITRTTSISIWGSLLSLLVIDILIKENILACNLYANTILSYLAIFLSSTSVTILVFSFFYIQDYYFNRIKNLSDSEISMEILVSLSEDEEKK